MIRKRWQPLSLASRLHGEKKKSAFKIKTCKNLPKKQYIHNASSCLNTTPLFKTNTMTFTLTFM